LLGKVLGVGLALFVLSGCALTTYEAEIALDPSALGKSPLSTIEPLKVKIMVTDHRPAEERDKIGQKKNGVGMELAPVVCKGEATQILADALGAEFSQNGHQVVEANSAAAQLLVQVDLNRFYSDMKMGMWDIKLTGIISTQVKLLRANDNFELISEPINSTAMRSEPAGSGGGMERALNDALLEFVRNFSRDPAIVGAMRGIK